MIRSIEYKHLMKAYAETSEKDVPFEKRRKYRVKKEVFEWIRTGQETIELRKGKTRKGMKQFFNAEEKF